MADVGTTCNVRYNSLPYDVEPCSNNSTRGLVVAERLLRACVRACVRACNIMETGLLSRHTYDAASALYTIKQFDYSYKYNLSLIGFTLLWGCCYKT